MLNVQIYDTVTLLGVLRELAAVPSYWLSLCFPNQLNSQDEWIEFEKVSEYRKIAPLVVPHAQGKPIYDSASTVTRVKPAYSKPKDTVNPARVIRRQPGDLAGPSTSNPLARFNAIVADIMRQHRNAIERLWEWLACKAIIDGKVVLVGDGYPEVTIDFQRSAAFTRDLTTETGATPWDDSVNVDILSDIEAWRDEIRVIQFGGRTNRMTVGPTVWKAMRNNVGIKAQLDLFTRGTNASLITGLRAGGEAEYVGNLGGDLEIYVYNDYYQRKTGEVVPFMAATDIVLTGPNIQGTRCFGAILDEEASFNALPIFPKMWKDNDPPATYVMNQSAPLMVPVNPNNTFRAKVVEAEV